MEIVLDIALLEKALVFYRKAIDDLSKILVEAVFKLWKERTEAIKKREGQMNNEKREHSQGSNHSLPAEQPTLSHSGRLPHKTLQHQQRQRR